MGAAIDAIRSGEVVGLPTDTVYGIGVDPLNESAVEKLYNLKGRPEHKPVGLLVASLDQAQTGAEIFGDALALAESHWPGALTLVVVPKVILADWVGDSQRRTVGMRVPDHQLARDLLEAVGPLAVTSANRSGGAETLDHLEAQSVFGDGVAVYLKGVSPGGVASTVVDATSEIVTVLREGPLAI